MPTSTRKKQEYFDEAKLLWNLDSLYHNLAQVKGRSLTPSEKLHLRGLLCGYSPAEIAEQIERDVHGIEVGLSDTIYRYVKLLVHKEKAKIDNWRNISEWLETAGFKKKIEMSLSPSQTGVEVPLKNLDGLIRVNRIDNHGGVVFEINLRGTAWLPPEEKHVEAQRCKEDVEEGNVVS